MSLPNRGPIERSTALVSIPGSETTVLVRVHQNRRTERFMVRNGEEQPLVSRSSHITFEIGPPVTATVSSGAYDLADQLEEKLLVGIG